MASQSEWLTHREAAAFLGMTESAVEKRIRDRHLRRRRAGPRGIFAMDLVGQMRKVRVTWQQVEEFLKTKAGQ